MVVYSTVSGCSHPSHRSKEIKEEAGYGFVRQSDADQLQENVQHLSNSLHDGVLPAVHSIVGQQLAVRGREGGAGGGGEGGRRRKECSHISYSRKIAGNNMHVQYIHVHV